MPLSKKRNRNRMRVFRATLVQPRVVHLVRPAVQPIPPYNPAIHRLGIEITLPEIDADGNLVPDY